jgi:hypothetical protein
MVPMASPSVPISDKRLVTLKAVPTSTFHRINYPSLSIEADRNTSNAFCTYRIGPAQADPGFISR